MQCLMSFYWIPGMTGTTYTFYKREKAIIRKETIRKFSQISARGGVEQRPRDRYALFHLLIQQTRPTTKNGREYTHLWNKHANPFRWPRNNNILLVLQWSRSIECADISKLYLIYTWHTCIHVKCRLRRVEFLQCSKNDSQY